MWKKYKVGLLGWLTDWETVLQEEIQRVWIVQLSKTIEVCEHIWLLSRKHFVGVNIEQWYCMLKDNAVTRVQNGDGCECI